MRAFLAVTLLLASTAAHANERVEHRFESSAPAGAVRRVVIDLSSGDITIRNGPADRLSVSGTVSREPDSDSRAREQRIVNDTAVEIVVRNNEAVVQRKFGPDAQGWRSRSFTNYVVLVELPPGLAVDVKTRAGEITLDGRFGDIDVDLRAGEIDARLLKADVRELRASCRVGEVRTNIGNEVTEREGLFPGRTRYLNPQGRFVVNLHTTAGEVNVELK